MTLFATYLITYSKKSHFTQMTEIRHFTTIISKIGLSWFLSLSSRKQQELLSSLWWFIATFHASTLSLPRSWSFLLCAQQSWIIEIAHLFSRLLFLSSTPQWTEKGLFLFDSKNDPAWLYHGEFLNFLRVWKIRYISSFLDWNLEIRVSTYMNFYFFYWKMFLQVGMFLITFLYKNNMFRILLQL